MDKISILGTGISKLESYEKTYDLLKEYLKEEKPAYVTVNNVHTVVTAVRNKKYRQIINGSFLSLPDGKPLSVIAKIKGYRKISRIFGPTFFEKSIEWGQKDGITHFLFGSTEAAQEKILMKIRKLYPQAKIAGKLVPPFREFSQAENDEFVKKINNSNGDIIWVALGAPNQERWIYDNYYKLNHGIMIGIGAGFDYFAGNLKHAPGWMKNFSLEWFYRLLQEPSRLWKRYLFTNSLFIYYVILDFLKIKKFN